MLRRTLRANGKNIKKNIPSSARPEWLVGTYRRVKIMLSYLFLLAAAIAAPEIPTTDLTPAETEAIQEIVTVLAQEENSEMTISDKQTAAETSAAPIIITNAIEPNMLEYKHWTGKYSPDTFTITVNGITIDQQKTCELPAHTTTVEIGYTYSFMNGMKTGGRKILYQVNENITQAQITFNWKDDWRIILDNGKAVKEITS